MSNQSQIPDNSEKYQEKVEVLKAVLKGNGSLAGLNKTTSNLFRARKTSPVPPVSLAHFNQIVSLDIQNLTADIEGLATYESIVSALGPLGYLPEVVPVFKTITIGGAVAGIGLDSSSFKYGFVHETVLEMDILTGNGDVITCTEHNEYRDLFWGFPNSYGSLGYVLRVKVKLRAGKNFVEVQNHKYRDVSTFLANVGQMSSQKDEYDYIDGVVFSPREMYIITGKFTDEAPYVSNYKSRHIYYKSILDKETDFLKTLDYIWRWDTDWFWHSRHYGAQNPLVRLLLGKRRLCSSFYGKVRRFCKKSGISWLWSTVTFSPKESIFQDVSIPLENAEEFLNIFINDTPILPIWVCPVSPPNQDAYYSICPMESGLYLNFGLRAVVSGKQESGYFNMIIEKEAESLKGRKLLHSESYYTPESFWHLHNKEAYGRLKKRYGMGFPGLFDKCVTSTK